MKQMTHKHQMVNYAKLYQLFKESHRYSFNYIKEQVIDLYEKQLNREFVLTFAGHFSAGKSSMINHLIGENILPKSPIPTSANIVKIKPGQGAAHIYLNNGKIVSYDPPYDINELSQFCQNKTDIKRVDLLTTAALPDHLVIIDTPGIDAADDRDRQLTESSLHLVDVLFYVMDYNHVQSEVNLSFLQRMQQRDIPIYLIINQIDKHQTEELSFSQFQQRLEKTFTAWELQPVDIFYTSLVNFDLPYNEYERLRKTILSFTADEYMSEDRSTNHVLQTLIDDVEQKYTDDLKNVEITNDQKEAFQHNQEIERSIAELTDNLLTFQKKYKTAINTTLNNAPIISFETRELAQSFLESQQSDFSVGFFRRKQKTKEARAARLKQFFISIDQATERHVTWRLREKIQQLLQTEHVYDQTLLQKCQSLDIRLTKEDLKEHIHKGATLTNRYLLNYTKTVADMIKQRFRKSCDQLLQDIEAFFQSKIEKKNLQLEKNARNMADYHIASQKRKQIKQEKAKEIKRLKTLFSNELKGFDKKSFSNILENNLQQRQTQTISPETVNLISDKTKSKLTLQNNDKQTSQNKISDENKLVSLRRLIPTIDQAIQRMDQLTNLSHIRKSLQSKRQQIDEQQFTVALFGAFSAGKSTFANALLGESILPTSPNPTTATITKIRPISEDQPHGTIQIHFKDEKKLFNELNTLLDDFSPQAATVDDMVQWIISKEILQHQYLNDLTRAYIQAIVDGYQTMKQYFGQKSKVSTESFHEIVADETKACFVEGIDMYYDCSLTRDGITLVDTPGADSMYSRHTNISFDYIKHADAIIYVTYYNHAFSRADRTFLTQLGRVKDAFELDKMFFIINAIDLAKDTQEIDLVQTHVVDELQTLGIRLPNIFPVSSKQSLDDPQNKYMKILRQSLDQFIQYDLMDVILQGIKLDIKRAKQTINQALTRRSLDVQERQNLLHELHLLKDQSVKTVNQFEKDIYEQRLKERIKRQLYYVQQRLDIRFHELFRDNFNPTTITSKDRSQLEFCLTELINDTGFELLQELQAVSLRMEKKVLHLMEEIADQISQDLLRIDEYFILSSFDHKPFPTLKIDRAFQSISANLFSEVLRLFRNPRTFFEKRQAEQMRDNIYEKLVPLIKKYLQAHEYRMIEHFTSLLKSSFSEFKTFAQQEIINNYEIQKQSIEQPLPENLLIETYDQLKLIYNNHLIKGAKPS